MEMNKRRIEHTGAAWDRVGRQAARPCVEHTGAAWSLYRLSSPVRVVKV